MKSFYLLIIFLCSCHSNKIFLSNAYNEPLRWKKEVKFYFHKDFPSKKRTIAREEISTLNRTIGIDLVSISNEEVKEIDTTKNVLYWNTNNQYKDLNPSEQARTSLHWRGDEILEANIYFSPNFEEYDFRSLFRHELSHALGFKHVEDQSSLMSPVLMIGEEKTYSLEQIQTIIKIYGDSHKTAKIED